MTSLPKKTDIETAAEPAPVSNGGPDVAEEQRIRELVEEGLASGPPVPVDQEFFERLRARAGKRS